MASSITGGWPGVRVKIVDNSQYIEALPSNLIGFICLFSEKGPDNVPRLTTSVSDFIKTYGAPHTKFGEGGYVATQYLQTLSNLYVMRVLPKDATYASKALKLTHTDTVTKYQKIEETNADGETVTTYQEIIPVTVSDNAVVLTSEDLNKNIEDILVDVPEGTDVVVPEGTFGYSFDTAGTKFKGARASVKPTSADERTGGETVIAAPVTPSGDVDISGVTFKGNAISTNFNNGTSVIVVTNSIFKELGEAAGSNPISVVSYDSSDPETTFESEENVVVKTVTERDYSFADVETNRFKNVDNIKSLLTGDDSAADIIFYPFGRGAYYNKIGYKLTKARKSYPNAFVLDVYELTDDSSFNNLVESFIVSFDVDARDSAGSSIFIKDVLDRYSEYLKCEVSDNIGHYDEDSESEDGLEEFHAVYDNLSDAKPKFLSGGTDGDIYLKSGVIDWEKADDDLALAYLGQVINPETNEANDDIMDTENLQFTVVFDAGYDYNVKRAIASLCDYRNTCFGILDNGYFTTSGNKNAQAAIDMRHGDNNFNDYRLALYEPYTKVYDNYNARYVWMTPVYHVVDMMTKTARDYDIFYAFAGLKRGVANGVKDYRYKLAGGFRDFFKDEELNPIVRFTQGGDVLWGNWTTQQTPSALKNVHVVLCLQYIQRTLERNLKQYIYEFNDQYTFALIKNTINSFLSELQAQRALESFAVSVTATDYQKQNNQCQVDINLKVTGVIEIINVSLNVG